MPAVLAAAAWTGCGGGGQLASHEQASRSSAASTPPPSPATTAAPRHSSRGRAQLQAELTRELRRAGPDSAAYVYDLTTGMPVFAVRARVGRPPASVDKLYTSVALLNQLGPDARLQTTVLGVGFLGPHGAWHGNLYLRGGGDPTFGSAAFNRVWEGGYGPSAAELAAQLAGLGIRRVTGAVIGDGSRFDPLRGGPSSNFAPDIANIGGELGALTYNHGTTAKGAPTPGAYATEQLALALHGAKVRAGVTPRHARVLATVDSPPLSILLRLMDVPSDDFFAEMLTKQLGARFAGDGSTAAGTRVITHAVAAYGVHPQVHDGSGLSRADSTSPAEVVDLLSAVWRDPLGKILRDSLPVLGVNGTTRRIATGTVAQGRCVAKTGTLDYVSNLAGYCDGAGHQQLAFAIFIDGPPNQPALTIEGRMVADIVKLDAAAP